ncbi:MAG TPA: hypothetical protein P5075_08235 [Eubacteriales bacterium]|nr:hypothetical protein [Eubacteriales bacterium]
MKVCNYCGTLNEDNETECTSCGAHSFSNKCANCGEVFETPYCPNCGAKAGAEAFVCPECGTHYFSAACPNCGYSAAREAGEREAEENRSSYDGRQSEYTGVTPYYQPAEEAASSRPSKAKAIWEKIKRFCGFSKALPKKKRITRIILTGLFGIPLCILLLPVILLVVIPIILIVLVWKSGMKTGWKFVLTLVILSFMLYPSSYFPSCGDDAAASASPAATAVQSITKSDSDKNNPISASFNSPEPRVTSAVETAAPQAAPTPYPSSRLPASSAMNAVNELIENGVDITNVIEYDEETDPNGQIGQPNGYTQKVNFTFNGEYEGTVEVFANIDDATARAEYIEKISAAAPIIGYYVYQRDLAVFRLELSVAPSDAEAFESALGSLDVMP